MKFLQGSNIFKRTDLLGLIATVLFSLTVLFVFYGKIILSANSVYFSPNGDALSEYINTEYHVKVDSNYLHVDSQNYPFGEHQYFVGTMPVISNTMKFVCNFFDISDYTMGVMNLSILFSLVICATFLYLIFRKLKIDVVFSILFAVGLAFLSPQISRMTGHLSLSFTFALPALFYLLLSFYQNPTAFKSLCLALLMVIMGSFHPYYFALSAFVMLFFWGVNFLSEKRFRQWKFLLINCGLQFFLPLLIHIIINSYGNQVSDRPRFPYGFLQYTSNWGNIFLTGGTFDTFLRNNLIVPDQSFEGTAYLGHFSAIMYFALYGVFGAIPFFYRTKPAMFLILLIVGVLLFFVIRKRRNPLIITDNRFVNILLWVGLLAMFVSFGYPFKWYPDSILYLGPIKQIRALGRFSWIFVYSVNISAVFVIYNIKLKNIVIRNVIIGVAVLLIFYDGYQLNRNMGTNLYNKIDSLEINSGSTIANDIFNKINSKEYQAILSLPYFHRGNDNFEKTTSDIFMAQVFTSILKTELPSTSVYLARTSMGQTIKQLQVVMEPYRPLEILDDLPNNKPILLVVSKKEALSTTENYLAKRSELLGETEEIGLYKLNIRTLERFCDSLYVNTENEFSEKKTYNVNGFLSTDSILNFVYNDFDDTTSSHIVYGNGAFKGELHKEHKLYEGNLPYSNNGKYVVSFWQAKISTDMHPRTIIIYTAFDEDGNELVREKTNCARNYQVIDNDLALVEFELETGKTTGKLEIVVWNNEMLNDTLYFDELLIRPAGLDIYRKGKDFIYKNNRFYYSGSM